jgi:hypothetical protein
MLHFPTDRSNTARTTATQSPVGVDCRGCGSDMSPASAMAGIPATPLYSDTFTLWARNGDAYLHLTMEITKPRCLSPASALNPIYYTRSSMRFKPLCLGITSPHCIHDKVMSNSKGASARTPSDKVEEKTSEVRDVESGEDQNALQQQASEPPYSIFTQAEKVWIVLLVSISALISPFGGTLFYPVLNLLSGVLHITPTMTNISITTYMV